MESSKHRLSAKEAVISDLNQAIVGGLRDKNDLVIALLLRAITKCDLQDFEGAMADLNRAIAISH